MKLMLLVLLILSGVALVCPPAAAVTRHWRRQLQAYEEARRAAQTRRRPATLAPEPSAAPTMAQTAPDPPGPVPEDERPIFYLRRLFNYGGLQGLCFLPLLVAFVIANTSLMAEVFEFLRDRPGSFLGQLNPFGLSLQITDFHLYAWTLSAALILVGGAYGAASEARSRVRWFLLGGVLVVLVGFEAWATAQLGFILATEDPYAVLPPLVLAVNNGLQGYLCAVTEAVSGFFVVERLFIPFLQAVGWSGVALVRAVNRAVRGVRRARAPMAVGPAAEPALAKPGFWKRIGAYLDEAWFDPLRSLDRHAASLLRRMLQSRTEVAHA